MRRRYRFPRHTYRNLICPLRIYRYICSLLLCPDVPSDVFLHTFGKEMTMGLPVNHLRCVLRITTWKTAQIFARLKRGSSAAMDFCGGLLGFVQGPWPWDRFFLLLRGNKQNGVILRERDNLQVSANLKSVMCCPIIDRHKNDRTFGRQGLTPKILMYFIPRKKIFYIKANVSRVIL